MTFLRDTVGVACLLVIVAVFASEITYSCTHNTDLRVTMNEVLIVGVAMWINAWHRKNMR